MIAVKVAIVAFLAGLHVFPPTWVVDLLLVILIVGGFLTAGSGLGGCLVTDKRWIGNNLRETFKNVANNTWQTFKNIFIEDPLAEIGNLCRRTFKRNCSEIKLPNAKQGEGRLILGALPNRTVLTAEQLKSGIKIEADNVSIDCVLSINSPAERIPRLSMNPNTATDYRNALIGYKKIDIRDHEPLSIEQLNKAADAIHAAISNGRNLYVHCKAGNGRSGMAVAAYLIKYRCMSVDQACNHVKTSRPKSTVKDKTFTIKGPRHIETFKNGKKTEKLHELYESLHPEPQNHPEPQKYNSLLEDPNPTSDPSLLPSDPSMVHIA